MNPKPASSSASPSPPTPTGASSDGPAPAAGPADEPPNRKPVDRLPPGHGVFVRVWRLARVAALVVRGLLTALFILKRPSVRLRNRHMQPWCASLLEVLDIELDVHGRLPDDDAPVFIAGNHVSWLDIWVLNAICPTLFVAKSEIRHWPVVGWLAARVGTLFIERARRSDTRKINDRIVARLAVSGERIAVFPEGTTTDGSVVRPFHASLFQPAVAARARVFPVAIRYLDGNGERSVVAPYTGELSLMASAWRIAGARGLRAELHFLKPIEPADHTRRELAALSQERISRLISGG